MAHGGKNNMAATRIHLFANSPYERVLEIEREEDVPAVTQTLKELIVKLWLISQGRHQEAIHYAPEIEQVAMQEMGFTITPRDES